MFASIGSRFKPTQGIAVSPVLPCIARTYTPPANKTLAGTVDALNLLSNIAQFIYGLCFTTTAVFLGMTYPTDA